MSNKVTLLLLTTSSCTSSPPRPLTPSLIDRRGRIHETAVTTLSSAREYFGVSVSDAGDVNGDGYGDVIVGAFGDEGAALVYHGSSAGVKSTAATPLVGDRILSNFGWSVSGAGDVNADGYSDVIVGAWGVASGTGEAYLYLGSASGILPSTATTLSEPATARLFGEHVSGAGDVNGDGYDDVIVGGINYDEGVSRAYVYLGGPSGLDTEAATQLKGPPDDGGEPGMNVASAGDVNQDGYDDVIIGAWGVDSLAGWAAVYYGSADGLDTTAPTTMQGTADYECLGWDVSGAGDINGDGYDDALVARDCFGEGAVLVFLGGADGLESTPTATLTGAASDRPFGYDVRRAGDVNHDGYDDVIIGVSVGDAAYLYQGHATGLDASPATTLSGAAGSEYGQSVSGAGDVNGDGYADVIIGAPHTQNAYLYHGYAEDDDEDGWGVDLDCDDADAEVHPEATELPNDGIDQDCDGEDATVAEDTADTADTAGTADTADTADTAPEDSGDAGPLDTGAPKQETCGCSAAHGRARSGLLTALGLLSLAVLRRPRAASAR